MPIEKSKAILVLVPLLALTGCASVGYRHPKSTIEILRTIATTERKDFYSEIEGIPEFDPQRHSDGCSGGMSAAYARATILHAKYGRTLPWRPCCVVHDRAYYYGGIKDKKRNADRALKACVDGMVGCKGLGLIVKLIVAIGGAAYFPTSYRWGYGEDFRGTEDLPAHDDQCVD